MNLFIKSRLWRSSLVRELSLVLLIKLVIIYFLKVMFFSEPVAVSWRAPDIDQVLLEPEKIGDKSAIE
ncbi:MAG: cytochrome oxidase putative small subunit CydP [Pseudomonadota bacterium]